MCAFGDRVVDQGLDPVCLPGVHQRADDVGLVVDMPGLQLGCAGEEFLHERLVNAVVDQQLFRRHANLALVHEAAEIGGLCSLFEIGIFQHDHRILAAEFDAALLEMRAAFGRDVATHGCRPGE